MGYLVWGEFGDWGCNDMRGGGTGNDNQQPNASYLTQWLEALERALLPPRHRRLVPPQRDAPET